jgi:WhiB family redox-sensing transcriptional regulator
MSILSSVGGGRAYGVSTGDEMPDSWRDQGLCVDIDPEFFFPVGDGPVALEQAEEAKAVCLGCPVLSECREFELTSTSRGRLRSEAGVFAAMTPDERRAELRRRARQARRATAAGSGVAA